MTDLNKRALETAQTRWQRLVNTVADTWNNGTVPGNDEEAVEWAIRTITENGAACSQMREVLEWYEIRIAYLNSRDHDPLEVEMIMHELELDRGGCARRALSSQASKVAEAERLALEDVIAIRGGLMGHETDQTNEKLDAMAKRAAEGLVHDSHSERLRRDIVRLALMWANSSSQNDMIALLSACEALAAAREDQKP